MSLITRLAQIKSRYDEVSALMGAGNLTPAQIQKYSKEFSDLEPLAQLATRYNKMLENKKTLEDMVDDPDLGADAADELYDLNGALIAIEDEIKLALVPKSESDTRNAILEIRAGTGGDEAALFVADLFAMYRGYAASQGWGFELMDVSESDIGGMKEVVVEITGANVFQKLKFESGVHRVQRVPKTEASGRVHTSAATVAVMPEAEDVEIDINEGDLRVDTYRAQGAGGQHVNKTDSAIRITHIPTGIVVQVQDERSQHKNRAKAMKILKTRMMDAQQSRVDAERADLRREQVGSGDRSERIRTYNFPQSRVTDHRIGLTLQSLPDVMKGPALDDIITPLLSEENARKLAELMI
jgi:peptide chain release factor 1